LKRKIEKKEKIVTKRCAIKIFINHIFSRSLNKRIMKKIIIGPEKFEKDLWPQFSSPQMASLQRKVLKKRKIFPSIKVIYSRMN